MAYAIGHISGCHLNPAVSVGLFRGQDDSRRANLFHTLRPRCSARSLPAVSCISSPAAKPVLTCHAGFASNGYGAHSPGGYTLLAAAVTEVVMTAIFLFVIMGATDKRAPQGFAPIAIGLCLTLIHLISIPVTNTSVNPARSTGVAVFAGGWPIAQLWLFWIAPIVGAAIGATFIAESPATPTSRQSKFRFHVRPQCRPALLCLKQLSSSDLSGRHVYRK